MQHNLLNRFMLLNGTVGWLRLCVAMIFQYRRNKEPARGFDAVLIYANHNGQDSLSLVKKVEDAISQAVFIRES